MLMFKSNYSQNLNISGFVKDSLSGEALINATIYNTQSKTGVITNEYGYFSINVDQSQTLEISFVGYRSKTISVNFQRDSIINILLAPGSYLGEIVVTGNRHDKVNSTQMSVARIDPQKTSNIPQLIGENDLVKTIQLLPGVHSGTEGTGGMHIRGSGQGDNLVLLDGAPVYNVNHLWGFFSVFNTDAIHNVDFIKGGFPARYGGRTSSVLDIRMKEGNNQSFAGQGSIGLLSSRFTLEGPIVKNKSSFILSGRRTYFDLIARPFSDNGFLRGYHFYDLNSKISYEFSPKSKIFLSAYTGKDDLALKFDNNILRDDSDDYVDFNTGWGNLTTTLRWSQIAGKNLFFHTNLIYSRYDAIYNSNAFSEVANQKRFIVENASSGLEDFSASISFTYIPNQNHYLRFGTNYTYHKWLPLEKHNKISDTLNTVLFDSTFYNRHIYSNEFHLYIEDKIDLFGFMKTNIGLHYSSYSVKDKTYHSFEPRLSTVFVILPDKLSVKASYSRMNQYVQQYPNILEIYYKNNLLNLSMNPEVWLPVTDNLPPQRSDQVAIGFVYTPDKMFDLTIEGFLKKQENVLSDNENFAYNENPVLWEDIFEVGKGWSKGLELMFEKKEGKLTGWLAYTISKTERQFDNINNGERFPYIFDRRHDLSLVANHTFSNRFDLGIIWVYASGRKMTLPEMQYVSNFNINTGFFNSNKNDVILYSKKNAYTLTNYQRLDIGINLHKEKRHFERTWSFGVTNAYNHHNSFIVYTDYDALIGDNNSSKVMNSICLFPVMPYFKYSFHF